VVKTGSGIRCPEGREGFTTETTGDTEGRGEFVTAEETEKTERGKF